MTCRSANPTTTAITCGLTTNESRAEAFLQRLRHHRAAGSSWFRRNATDSAPDRILQSSSSMSNRRIRLRHTIARSQRRDQPRNTKFISKLSNLKNQTRLLTPLLLELMATIGLHVLVFGLYRSADDSSVASSRPPTA